MSVPVKKAAFAANAANKAPEEEEAAKPKVKRSPGRPAGAGNGVRRLQREPAALELGGKLRRLRLEAGLSMEKLAQAGKISTSYVSRLESGDINPTVNVLSRLVGVFGLTIDGLLNLDACDPGPDNTLVAPDELDMEVKVWFYKLKGKSVSEGTKRLLAVVIEEELKERAAATE